jgi:hypothetical protein
MTPGLRKVTRVALPGFEWLRRQLAGTDAVSGGWQAKMKHPLIGGAAFAMAVVWVLMWLLALAPLCLCSWAFAACPWQTSRARLRALRSGPRRCRQQPWESGT